MRHLFPLSARRAPERGASRSARRAARTAIAAGAVGVLAAGLLAQPGGVSAPEPIEAADLYPVAANPPTPGKFIGHGFDQCEAPSQRSMDAWLQHSPFLAAGIYISGASRGCKRQTHLTPSWVKTQLAKGWRLLPITLGPQSSCTTNFPRYGRTIDPTISTRRANGYAAARRQGVVEAGRAVSAAKRLGIVPRSTLWYDLEGWSDYRNAPCRESALAFVSGWTQRVKKLGYVSGVYSSAGSGMKVLDDARVQRRRDVTLPDRIWIARWDNKPNTSTSYIREDGWRPGNRVKQYQGPHHERHGGVTIDIDRNWVQLGRGARKAAPARHCGGIDVDLPAYTFLKPRTQRFTPDRNQVRALKCLLRERGSYRGKMGPHYNKALVTAVKQWRRTHSMPVRQAWTRKAWVTLFASGAKPVVKVGSTGPAVRDLQRAMKTVYPNAKVPMNGVFTYKTRRVVRTFQKDNQLRRNGNGNTPTWRKLATKPFGF